MQCLVSGANGYRRFTVDFDRKEMGYSPDRVDALVWALTELMIEGDGERQSVRVMTRYGMSERGRGTRSARQRAMSALLPKAAAAPADPGVR
jgi:hypothetical protein